MTATQLYGCAKGWVAHGFTDGYVGYIYVYLFIYIFFG